MPPIGIVRTFISFIARMFSLFMWIIIFMSYPHIFLIVMYQMDVGTDVGKIAPDFTLKDSSGDEVKLSGYRNRVNVLLAFYRGESDVDSLRWLSQLKDDYLYFRGLDTEVLAASPDNMHKAKYSADRYKIPFKLLCDPKMNVIKEYGVFDDLYDGAEASVFIIDRSGRIRYKYIGRAPRDIPPNEVLLDVIRKLQ